MSALALTLLSFAIILALTRLKTPLWLAVIAGAVALGFFFHESPADLARVAVAGATRNTSIGLLMIMASLLILSEAMRQTGRLEQIVGLVNSFFRRPAVTLAALPALIGLLPMPGGALFSAPMVRQAAGADNPPDGNLLSAVNYWWRHIWEHWWPLYPGVILAMSLTNSDLLTFIGFQMPMGVFMAVGGLLILRSLHPDLHKILPMPQPGTTRKLLLAVAPIGCILIVWFIGDMTVKTALRSLGPNRHVLSAGAEDFVAKFVPLLIGLWASLAFTLLSNPLSLKQTAGLAMNKEMPPVLGLVLSVMIYQQMLQDVNAAARIGSELTALHVPVTLVVILLPFIAGMLTGIAFGFVGVSFPLVLSLVAALPDHPAMRPYSVLAYASGHLGMMLSPIHLCYVVSNRYFAATFKATYRHILTPCLLVAVLTAGYFILLKWAL